MRLLKNIFIRFLSTFILGVSIGCSIFGQAIAQQKRMLLFEINNNRYVKYDFDKQGKLSSFQKLKMGSLKKKPGIYKLPVKIYSYLNNGKLEDSTQTAYICKPEEKEILINILPFANINKSNELRVDLLGPNAFYPVDPKPGWKMKELKFEMKITKGFIGFLGGEKQN